MKRMFAAALLLLTLSACSSSNSPTAATNTTTTTPTKIMSLGGNLSFGALTLGQQATGLLTITNSGNATMTVTGISLPCGGQYQWSFTAGTVAPGATTNVTVIFTPTSVENCTGTITVTADQTSGTNTIAIAASATSPTVTSYQGVWNVSQILTSKTGSCAGPGVGNVVNDGLITVNGSGGFTVPNFGEGSTGTMNLSSGTWSSSEIDTGNPGDVGCSLLDTMATLSSSGTCSSFTACAGTFSETTSPSGGAIFYSVTWSR